MKLILLLRREDKQKADSPCEESEYRGKLKTRPKRTQRSVPKNAKRSFLKAFLFVPKTFRSVLEAFRFVQTVQRSRGVVVRFRVCTSINSICIFWGGSSSVSWYSVAREDL